MAFVQLAVWMVHSEHAAIDVRLPQNSRMGKTLWTPSTLTVGQRSLAERLAVQFSEDEAYIINRYLEFCRVNEVNPFEVPSTAACAAQMLDCGCKGSYAALYVRTIRKLYAVNGARQGQALERVAANVEFMCRADERYSPAVLTAAEVAALRTTSDTRIALVTELMLESRFRRGDVGAICGTHVTETPGAFLITLFGGKNHRKATRVGKATLRKSQISTALVAHLHRMATRHTHGFTTISTRAYNDRISAIVGRRITSRSVREYAIDEVLAKSYDAQTGSINYDAAARLTHHGSGNTLRNSYHKRPIDASGRM